MYALAMQIESQTTIIQAPTLPLSVLNDIASNILGKRENNPDYLELTTKEKQSIGIKETRELIKWLQLKPFQSQAKLAIVYEAEKLTTEAQNSLLKTLEEPPKNSYIILITYNHKRLLQTIISRSELIVYRDETSTSKELQEDIAKLMKSDLPDKIKWIDSIHKIKDKRERKSKIRNTFEDIYRYTQSNSASTKEKYENLKLIEQSYTALERNVNIKLILENLLFNFK